jgi:sterol desaturase/sphingolipid hydroxylase (fatty acid hydroxylase superfamily)
LSEGWYLPSIAFVLLVLAERIQPRVADARYTRADVALNLLGLAIQGILIPLLGYLIATRVLQAWWPQFAGTLHIGWWGAFALNFVVVDFLYYWQHRLLHRVPWLWRQHQCHHATPALNVWATSRNSLPVNLLMVYLLVNPLLAFLCDRPGGFFVAASLTAALDLWRHARVAMPRIAGRWLVTPFHHHLHHSPAGQAVNFGANLLLWDRLFGTLHEAREYPTSYGVANAPSAWRQLLGMRAKASR